MRKLLASTAGLCSVGRNFPVLAVIVLALLGAGCADEPQQAGQAVTVQSTKVATTAPTAPAAANDDDPLECEYLVPAGTVTHKWICFTASQSAPAAAHDDDPLQCVYVAPTGTMIHKWYCLTASDKTLLQQRGIAIPGLFLQ